MSLMGSSLSGLFVLAVWGMTAVLDRQNVALTLWQWAVYLAWLVWTLFGLALVWTLLGEREPRAVSVSSAVFGLPSLIGLFLVARLWIFAG